MRPTPSLLAGPLAALIAGLPLASFAQTAAPAPTPPAAAASPAGPSGAPPAVPMRDTPPSFAPLARQLLPAVVNISTTQNLRRGPTGRTRRNCRRPRPAARSRNSSATSSTEPARRPGPGRPTGGPAQPQRPRRAQSLGSGFIIDAERHHRDQQSRHRRRRRDQRHPARHTTYQAELLGTDPKTDLAVLRIKPTSRCRVCSSATATPAGRRLGAGHRQSLRPGGTVTAGIVSARDRDIGPGPTTTSSRPTPPINRGNSGGPLFNLRGRGGRHQHGDLLAVAAAPSASASRSPPRPRPQHHRAAPGEGGKVRRGWLGVNIQR